MEPVDRRTDHVAAARSEDGGQRVREHGLSRRVGSVETDPRRMLEAHAVDKLAETLEQSRAGGGEPRPSTLA
jgi:hypothetical protein